MKKELTAMLTASTDMSLKINGAFTLNVYCSNKFGENVAIAKDKEVATRSFSLLYTLAHDKMLYISRNLPSSTVEELMADITTAMTDIMNQVTRHLVKEFQNGHLLGEPKEV